MDDSKWGAFMLPFFSERIIMRELFLYEVDPQYLRYLHSFEHRVSIKYNNRPFVGVVTMISGYNYLIPLTSQTTADRMREGKGKRSALVTTFIRDGQTEIANLLHNNMIPVVEGVYSPVEVNAQRDTYLANEIRFIRKNAESIILKANRVHDKRIEKRDRFLMTVCCDFALLEEKSQIYSQS